MRPIVLIISFISNVTYGQDTVYVNSNLDPVKQKSALYYQVTESGYDTTVYRLYDMNHILREENLYAPIDKQMLQGPSRTFNDKGDLVSSIQYKDGRRHGHLTTYWPNGTIKRRELYDDATFVSGTCYDSTGQVVPFTPFYVGAEFVDGNEAMYNFILENLEYPRKSQKRKEEGEVIISFMVSPEGNITHVRIENGVNKRLDKEATRVINLMPKWKPALEDGIPVYSQVILPISFEL